VITGRSGRNGGASGVEGEAERTVAEDHHLVVVDGHVGGLVHHEGAEQPRRHLRRGVEVRVVHVRAGVADLELVGEGLAGHDRVLVEARHPVHVVGQQQAMEVDGRGVVELVVEHHPDPVPQVDVDARPRDLTVVRHGGLDLAGGHLPVQLVGGEVEHLRPVGCDLGLERLVAGPLRRDGGRRDPLVVQAGHLVGGELLAAAGHHRAAWSPPSAASSVTVNVAVMPLAAWPGMLQ